jgi:hypothetical protein
MVVGICRADHVTPLYLQKLALALLTSSGRSVGIVRSRTKAMGEKQQMLHVQLILSPLILIIPIILARL